MRALDFLWVFSNVRFAYMQPGVSINLVQDKPTISTLWSAVIFSDKILSAEIFFGLNTVRPKYCSAEIPFGQNIFRLIYGSAKIFFG